MPAHLDEVLLDDDGDDDDDHEEVVLDADADEDDHIFRQVGSSVIIIFINVLQKFAQFFSKVVVQQQPRGSYTLEVFKGFLAVGGNSCMCKQMMKIIMSTTMMMTTITTMMTMMMMVVEMFR